MEWLEQGYNNKLETPDDKLGVGGALVVFSRGWPGPTQRAAGRHTTVSQHSPSSASNDQLGSVMTRSVVVRGRGVKDYVDHHLSCSVCPAGVAGGVEDPSQASLSESHNIPNTPRQSAGHRGTRHTVRTPGQYHGTLVSPHLQVQCYNVSGVSQWPTDGDIEGSEKLPSPPAFVKLQSHHGQPGQISNKCCGKMRNKVFC